MVSLRVSIIRIFSRYKIKAVFTSSVFFFFALFVCSLHFLVRASQPACVCLLFFLPYLFVKGKKQGKKKKKMGKKRRINITKKKEEKIAQKKRSKTLMQLV